MATSGRKLSHFKEFLSVRSTEDFDICCDPCLRDGHHARAKGFCQNCQEKLCKTCLNAHRRTRASKHHQVEDTCRKRAVKSSVPPKQQNVCTEACIIHDNEVINFFCRNHQILGCRECITLNHRNCHIDYILDVCTDVTKSREFKKTFEDVSEKLKQSDDFSNRKNTLLAISRENIADTIEQIEEFQKRMNEMMNALKNKMMQNLKLAKTPFDKHVHEALRQNEGISSKLKSMKANLETYETTGQDAQAYTTMKQAQSQLKTLGISVFKDKLFAETGMYMFMPNEALVEMLSTLDGLGRIVNVVETQPGLSAHTLFSLTHDNDINVSLGKKDVVEVRTGLSFGLKNYVGTSDIRGCALLSPCKLVVTDCNNNNVKIVDLKKQSVVDVYTLPSWPFDVAVLPQDQVAVTLPEREEIQTLKTKEKLTTLRSIKGNRPGYGIAYHQDLLYVVCERPLSVLVLGMSGSVKRDIMLQSALNEAFIYPYNISISKNLQQMYISDSDNYMVVSLTLHGRVIAVYKDYKLQNTRGITMLEDGSLLVGCMDNGTIHHISADLTQGRKVAEGITFPISMCYDFNSKKVYVGSYYCDNIHVFSLKYPKQGVHCS